MGRSTTITFSLKSSWGNLVFSVFVVLQGVIVMAMGVQVESKASICQTCGSNQNKARLHRCIKCHISAEHRYCFAANPDKVDEDFAYICPQCVVAPVNGTSLKRNYEFRPRRSRVRKPKRQRVEQPAELVDELDVPTTVFLPSSEPLVVSEPPQADLNNDYNLANNKETEDTQMKDVHPGNETILLEEDSRNSKDQDKIQGVPAATVLKSYAKPIFEPSWRGSFDISGEIIDDLAVHLSANACWKVAETAKLMPVTVSTKIVPRLEIWPKNFLESAPTVDNIGLYLFPESDSGIKAFDQMMGQIIELDRALKVLLDNAELLLFSSTQLPVRYWRFNGKFYMWGVFTARKDALSPSRCVTESVRTIPVSLSKACIYSSDMPRKKDDIETLKTNNTLQSGSNVMQAQENYNHAERWRRCYVSPLIKTSNYSTSSPIGEKVDEESGKAYYKGNDIPSASIEPREEVKDMVKVKKVLSLPPFQPIGSLVKRDNRFNTDKISPESLTASSYSHFPDKPVSADEKTVSVVVYNKINMDRKSVKVENEGMCFSCWRKQKSLNYKSAEFIKKAKAEGMCFKCGGAGHLALACTTISDIICLNCGELTTINVKTNDTPIDGVESQQEIKEMVVLNNRPGKKTKKDIRSSEFIKKAKDESLCFKCGGAGHIALACTKISDNKCFNCGEAGHYRAACPKLQAQGSKKMGKKVDIALKGRSKKMGEKVDMALKGRNKKMGKKVDIALKGGVSKPDDPKARKEYCDFCGVPGHLRVKCRKFVSMVMEMKSCTLKEARLFCRDFEAISNVCNSIADQVGAPSPSHNSCNGFHNASGAEGPSIPPVDNACSNFGEVGEEKLLPPNDICNNDGGVGGPYHPPGNNVGKSSGGVGETYLPPNNVCNNVGEVIGPYHPPANNVCNNFGEARGETYLPPDNICNNDGGVGGPYHPPANNVCNNDGGVGVGTYVPPKYFGNSVGGRGPYHIPTNNVYNNSGWVGGGTYLPPNNIGGGVGGPYPLANNVCYNGGELGRGNLIPNFTYPGASNVWAGRPYLS